MVSLFLLNACTSHEDEAINAAKVQRLTIVSSGSPRDALPAFNTFSWRDQYSQVLSATDDKNASEIKEHIKSGIIKYLKTKGYVYQPDPIQADLVIGFLFALEDDIADKEIQQRFGLLPGVHSNGIDTNSYKKGSLLLAVLDNRLTQVYWRSAMQGFVELEKDKNDPTTERLQYILSMMMDDFPNAGQ
jgi:hypothetical protein